MGTTSTPASPRCRSTVPSSARARPPARRHLQKIFAGRTSLKAKVLQILVSNLVVSPIQNVIYLTSMAIIAGARTFHQVRATVKAGFMPVMKVSWIVSPLSLAFAQQFLPEHTWVPFFNVIGFIIGTYINAHTKKKRLEALKRKVCLTFQLTYDIHTDDKPYSNTAPERAQLAAQKITHHHDATTNSSVLQGTLTKGPQELPRD
ncbi:integral membrane protein [Trichophyton tonsurans CBS 112818]|uniref:Integral membrane protein n=1 Tax=Trichophyton tonsurans (strain CBS 112818) TaxID=647933 RepID=F2S1P2_TRIT1|nr:integral membrane protein [Trichophyton tonsurans CBS 112818]